MKRLVLFGIFGMFLFSPINSQAQILKKLKKKVERKIEREVDKEIDDAMSKKEKETDVKRIDSIPEDHERKHAEEQVAMQEDDKEVKKTTELSLNWSKYDFVPGDTVIFEDNQENEENGEFPSRWDLVRGTIENAKFGVDNIIMFRGGAPRIIPYLKNSDQDYLPDIFTVEFDLYLNNHNSFQILFWDDKNQRVSSDFRPLDIRHNSLALSPASSRIPNNGSIKDKWAHIAIAYTNGKMKAYINETRLINIPRLAFDPMGITVYAYSASDQNKFYMKNFRIAEGGVKFYDRMIQDGKIIASGIRFDVNKATIKPESMGVINKIYDLMSEHSDINFSVEGHTDSDGNIQFNQKLSEDRAQAVLKQLVSMGIKKDRLASKGYGEAQPIDNNSTAEGKANNRRVEFVKMEKTKNL